MCMAAGVIFLFRLHARRRLITHNMYILLMHVKNEWLKVQDFNLPQNIKRSYVMVWNCPCNEWKNKIAHSWWCALIAVLLFSSGTNFMVTVNTRCLKYIWRLSVSAVQLCYFLCTLFPFKSKPTEFLKTQCGQLLLLHSSASCKLAASNLILPMAWTGLPINATHCLFE